MKPQTKNPQSVTSQGIEKSVKFGIKSSGLHHILGILRNQLYSDKVLAVLREYSCNAVDAHAEAGCPDRPIEVTLPNRMNPSFKVRDFGPALNENEIQDVYAFYGESTKRNSNNQIGMLGIGSKSAFAYGDNFVINSFIDGKKYIYNAFIDPSQIGQISKIGEEDTSEENGIEIVVPVADDDTDEFRTKAEGLFQWFKVRPTIQGTEDFVYDKHESLFAGNGWEWAEVKSDRYRGYNNYGESVAVMGNIGYPIDTDSLNLDYEKDVRHLLCENLILRFDIGDLEISASRESLQYTDFTRKQIIERLEKVQSELAKQVNAEFKSAGTLFAAKQLWGSVFRTDSPLYRLRGVLKDGLKWKGKLIDGDAFDVWNYAKSDHSDYSTPDLIQLHSFKKSYRSSKYRPEECHNISCDKSTVVIENDLGHRRGMLSRILPLIIDEGKSPFLIQFNDEKAKKKFIKEEGFDAPMLTLSELEKKPLANYGYGSGTRNGDGSYTKNKKHSAKAFTLNWEQGRHADKKSDYFKRTDVDLANDEGVYIQIDRFYVMGVKSEQYGVYTGDVEPWQLTHRLKEQLEGLGIKLPKVYAFKTAMMDRVEKNKENWTCFFEWVKQEAATIVEQNCLMQKYKDRLATKQQVEDEWFKGRVDEKILDALSCPDGLFGTTAKIIEGMRNKKDAKALDSVFNLVDDLKLEVVKEGIEPTHDLAKMTQDIREKYEMLPLLEKYGTWNYDWDKKKDAIINYINIIDVCDASRVS